MSKAKKSPGKNAQLRVEGEMTIFRAAELKETMLAALEMANTLEVNLSGVTEFDTAGVQLLMLAKKTAQAAERELRLTGHSPAVLEALELLHLVSYFGDPVVIEPQESTDREPRRAQ